MQYRLPLWVLCLGAFWLVKPSAQAQSLGPEVTSWILNPGNEVGYNNIPSNVQLVRYSASNVYVSTTCIPGYDIGPWTGNPNTPINQNFVFKITRSPQQNTGTLTATPNGHIGVWTNGVSIFNASDARSYNNANTWFQDALVSEGTTFDDCLGHAAPNGEYHHHTNPDCLYDKTDSSRHSPIIGYAFDGYPIYGAWGYTNTDGTGGIARMRSSYRLRNISARTSLDGTTTLPANQQGPAVGGLYPLGTYIQDYEFVQGHGTLDRHNGRFCVTPEYPNGTYAYFVTINYRFTPDYPYTLGPTYYGVVQPGNTGPQSGHNTPSETVVVYSPSSTGPDAEVLLQVYPNPTAERVYILHPSRENVSRRVEVWNLHGGQVLAGSFTGERGELNVETLSPGIYLLRVIEPDGRSTERRLVRR